MVDSPNVVLSPVVVTDKQRQKQNAPVFGCSAHGHTLDGGGRVLIGPGPSSRRRIEGFWKARLAPSQGFQIAGGESLSSRGAQGVIFSLRFKGIDGVMSVPLTGAMTQTPPFPRHHR